MAETEEVARIRGKKERKKCFGVRRQPVGVNAYKEGRARSRVWEAGGLLPARAAGGDTAGDRRVVTGTGIRQQLRDRRASGTSNRGNLRPARAPQWPQRAPHPTPRFLGTSLLLPLLADWGRGRDAEILRVLSGVT